MNYGIVMVGKIGVTSAMRLLTAILITCMCFSVSRAQPEILIFWSTEFEPERVELQEEIIAAFEAQHPNIDVRLTVANENLVDRLLTLNLDAGTQAHIFLHPVQLSGKWVDDGILSVERATALIDMLGQSTFSEGALALVAVAQGQYASIPSDGWGQLLLYRSDLFADAALAAPTSYTTILKAAQALHDPDNDFYGFCGATSDNEVFTWQVFEHIALANGASFVAADGTLIANAPEMVEAIEFYSTLMQTAGQPHEDWYWQQTREAYMAGQCAMVIWSPFILDELAGLRDSALPSCLECGMDSAFIAKNTNVVSAFSGYSSDTLAAWGSTSNIGIAPDAPESAELFVEFWFNEAYLDVLSIAPEGKFPMRRGTAEQPSLFIDGWANLDIGVDRRAPLSDFYNDATLTTIVAGGDGYTRMGYDVGYGVLASEVGAQFFIQENLIAVINGNLTAQQAADNIQSEIQTLRESLRQP